MDCHESILLITTSSIFFLAMLYQVFQKNSISNNKASSLDKTLKAAIIFSLLMLVLMAYLIIGWLPMSDNLIKTPFITSAGMILASLLATFGVLTSITNTRELEQKKSIQDKKYKILYTIDVMNAINVLVDQFCKEEEKVKVNFTDNAKETLQISLTRNSEMVKKLIESIFNKDILPYLEETQRDAITGFYIEFNDFYMRYILSPSDNRPIREWNILSIDRYNHFNIFSNAYIIENSSYTK